MTIQDGILSIRYNRAQLLDLCLNDNPLPPCYAHRDCLYYSSYFGGRKRGKKGGIRQRLKRRGSRPPLPLIVLANVRSIRNKMDEISAHVRYDSIFRGCSIMCFTETWLDADDNDNFITIDGFSCVRGDRTAESGKKKGGGLCVYINTKYCNNYTVKKRICCPDLELIALSLRPFYLPREFGIIYIVLVYVPPTANTNVTTEGIVDLVHDVQTRSPDAPVVILGDFNKCNLNADLPTFYQYVSCPTREKRTLDLCYCNITGAYIAHVKPPIGSSDHQTIHLLPNYLTQLKRGKVIQKTTQEWTDDNILRLQGCFACTDWNVFRDNASTLEEWVDTVTNYIKFCEQTCISTKGIKIYPNNKPWINTSIKHEINKKKKAFMTGDRHERKIAQRNLNITLAAGRKNYQLKLENSLNSSNIKQAWNIMNTMTGAKSKTNRNIVTSDENKLANELNDFYCRFDSINFSDLRLNALRNVNIGDSVLEITTEQVVNVFKKVNPMKACGPDGVKGHVLKFCAQQLAEPFVEIFSTSLNNHEIPSAWKSSTIIPVPKIAKPLENNDYRPVALTSILCKCLEKFVKMFIMQDLHTKLDPLQFAYQREKGVDDAILYILNSVYKHLDLPNSYARLFFIDFSSAFNTMQIHILIEKMKLLTINPHIILWASEFLTQRPQRVKVNSTTSSVRTINTGAPQGAVTSPIWYILYTNDFKSSSALCSLTKFADDAALLGLLSDNSDLTVYVDEIKKIQKYCTDNFLILNVKKTKEMILDFRRGKEEHKCVSVSGEEVEIVQTFKYLGTVLDYKLNFSANTDYIANKAQQRLRLLRKLSFFSVSTKALKMFYQAHICNILTFNFSSWFGNLNLKNKNKLSTILNAASKIIGSKQDPFGLLFRKSTLKKARKILNIQQHPLNLDFILLPSQRRYRSPIATSNRHKNSFVPMAIKLLNEN